MTSAHKVAAVSAIGVVGVAILFLPEFYVSLLAFSGLFGLAAVGLVLLLQTGQVSLGHAAFTGLGAYVTAVVTRNWGMSAWIGMPAGMLVAALAALLIGAATLRLRGHYLPLATIAWGIALSVIFVAWIDVTGGASGLDGIPPISFFGSELLDDRTFVALIWASLGGVLASLSHFQVSRVGRAMRAVRANELMAQTFGVSTFALKLQVFILSAVLAALAGALYAHMLHFVSPTPFNLHASFKILIMAVLGGPGHVAGGALGALIIVGIEYSLQDLLPKLFGRAGNYEIIFFGAILVFILIKWPRGLWPLFAGLVPAGPAARIGPGESLPAIRKTAAAGPLLALDGVSVHFGGLHALDAISFSVQAGEIVGLIGPNGAGKTTAFNVIAGVFPASQGEIRLAGSPLTGDITTRIHRGMARTFQHVRLVSEMSVVENVAIGCHARTTAGVLTCLTLLDRAEEARIRRTAFAALERVGLAGRALEEIGSLPLGQQRLVEVARALAADPTLLLLDEPAAGLRHAERAELAALIRRLGQEGMTVLLIEHDMDLIMGLVDRTIVLSRGRILAEGRPEEIRRHPAVIEAYLGEAA